MSDAIAGLGIEIKRGSGDSSSGGGEFTKVAEIFDINPPNRTRETFDVTSHDDNNSGYREFLTGFRDGGEVTLSMHYEKTRHAAWLADFNSDDTVRYQIVFPDSAATTLEFSGLVTNIQTHAPLDDKMSVDVTIKVSGAIATT